MLWLYALFNSVLRTLFCNSRFPICIEIEDVETYNMETNQKQRNGNNTSAKEKPIEELDITQYGGYKVAMDDIAHGRVDHCKSVEDMFKSILGKETF